MTSPSFQPALIVVAGPTASGKTSLALHLAKAFNGEILSCDSVAVYRGLDVGSAKPTQAERVQVPHHGLDLLDPDQPATAGDYARYARGAIAEISARGRLPILAGGTGLYLRATLDGLAPSPPRDEALRERLRQRALRRGSPSLHRLLMRLDPPSAGRIHPNDLPKLMRSLEVHLLARQPQSTQWQAGREALEGFRILQLGLDPPRALLYEQINLRAARMFATGLLEETAAAAEVYGDGAGPLGSLGYAQALRVLRGQQPLTEAIAEAQQGHRNYAKRQLTWFRKDTRLHWLRGFGSEQPIQAEARRLVQEHLKAETDGGQPGLSGRLSEGV